jgi:phage terminase small subunit
MPLTHKQLRFVEEYLIDLNATQAYKRAGYKVQSDHSAQVNSSRLLSKAVIAEKIKEKIAERSAAAGITADDVWREWRYIACSDIGDILDFTGEKPKLKPVNTIPESARRSIKSVKVRHHLEGHGDQAREVEIMEFTLWDKPAALAIVARAMGELIERVEHSGPGGGAIPLEHTIDFPDIHTDEFRALSAEERMRRLGEAIRAISRLLKSSC